MHLTLVQTVVVLRALLKLGFSRLVLTYSREGTAEIDCSLLDLACIEDSNLAGNIPRQITRSFKYIVLSYMISG